MIVQIYTAQSPREAQALAEVGVDRVGITPSTYDLPGVVSYEEGRAIADATRGRAISVALTVDSDEVPVIEMVERVRPEILHSCGPMDAFAPEDVDRIKRRLGGIPVMQAIPMGDPRAVDLACAYGEVADYLILDTEAGFMDAVGASGKIHDWSVSRRIVETVEIPVILAGGLSPANVADAIAAVRPWGVDSLTHTNRSLPGGGFEKDLDGVKEFVHRAKAAERST